MEPSALSLTAKKGSVASRFVSQSEIDEARKHRPGKGEDEPYDPRSLYERIQAQKDAKQEEFDEKFKLSNQFRGIDEGESHFLAEVDRDRREAERRKREEEQRELLEFRKAALAREASPPNPLDVLGATTPSTSTAKAAPSSAADTVVPDQRSGASVTASAPTTSKTGVATITPASSSSKAGSGAKGKRKREGLAGIVRKKPATVAPPAAQSGGGTAVDKSGGGESGGNENGDSSTRRDAVSSSNSPTAVPKAPADGPKVPPASKK